MIFYAQRWIIEGSSTWILLRKGLCCLILIISFFSLSFSLEEIRKTIWSNSDDKSLDIDGYSSKFLKAGCPIIVDDVIDAIQQFFVNGKMLRAWNTTAINHIPKVLNPDSPSDYRSIACFYTLYKCVTKLICSKLKMVLGTLINTSLGLLLKAEISFIISSSVRISWNTMEGRTVP